MDIAWKIKEILHERRMTIRQLSDKLNYHGSAFYTKLSRNRFTLEEMERIADALNCDLDVTFVMRDTGKRF